MPGSGDSRIVLRGGELGRPFSQPADFWYNLLTRG